MKSDARQLDEFLPHVLALLACPKCKGKLIHSTSMNSLDCESCRLRYRISGGIPVLIQDEAKPF